RTAHCAPGTAHRAPRTHPAPRTAHRAPRTADSDRVQTMTDYAAIIPITIMALSAIAAMVAEAIRRPGERMPIFGFGLIGCAGAALASVFLWDSDAQSFGVIRSDNFALFINIVLCTVGILTMLLSHETVE